MTSGTDWLALPPARELRGSIHVPPSKSATNRALVLAAISQRPVEILRPLQSEDTAAIERCLLAMGAHIQRRGSAMRIEGPLGRAPGEQTLLDAGESGTAARFLTALAAAAPGRYLLTGSARLRDRPIAPLVSALRSRGAEIEYQDREGFLPLDIRGTTLTAGPIRVDASSSSQFVSALLLAAPFLHGGLQVSIEGRTASAPYVQMTLEALRAFGHDVSIGSALNVSRGVAAITEYAVPGDYSSALPLLSAVGIAGGEVSVRGLQWPSIDADARALSILELIGMEVRREKDCITAAARIGRLRAVTAAAIDFPDAVPALAALAAFAPGQSRFEGISHLRIKESDRIRSLASLIERAGASASEGPDFLLVTGPLSLAGTSPVRLATFGDHRIAMAAGLLALGRPGVMIERPDRVAKSYPAFFRDLDRLVLR